MVCAQGLAEQNIDLFYNFELYFNTVYFIPILCTSISHRRDPDPF